MVEKSVHLFIGIFRLPIEFNYNGSVNTEMYLHQTYLLFIILNKTQHNTTKYLRKFSCLWSI